VEGNNHKKLCCEYSPEDGPHGQKHVESEWKEIIITNFVATDGHYNEVLVTERIAHYILV
jgi:hypothetical protein